MLFDACDQRFQFCLGRAAVQRPVPPVLYALFYIFCPARHHKGGPGIQQHDVAVRALFAVQQPLQRGGIVGGIAASDVGQRPARQAGILGRDLAGVTIALVQDGDLGGGALMEISSSPSRAMHDEGAAAAQRPQRLGIGHQPVGREHPHQLARDPGGRGQRSQQIEDGAPADLLARLADMASSPGDGSGRTGRPGRFLPAPAAAASGSRSIFTPRASSTSAAPLREEAERLPCLATGTPHAATTKETAVEIFRVPSPSPPVPHRSMAPGGAVIARIWSRMEVTAPTSSSTVGLRSAVADR